MSLADLSRSYEAMRALNVTLQEALLEMQTRLGLEALAVIEAREKRERAEAAMVGLWRRQRRADQELSELKDYLVRAVIQREMAAAEWLVAVAEARAEAPPTVRAA